MPRRKQSPRTKAPKGTAANQRIEFCYHPSCNTPEGEVYQYLLRSSIWSLEHGKAMANETVVSRYLPYARQQHQPDLAQATAQHCVRQFLRYIDELCRDFGLEHPMAVSMSMAISTLVTTPTPETTGSSMSTAAPDESAYGKFDLFEEG